MSATRRILLSLFALAILYVNLAVIGAARAFKQCGFELPLRSTVYDSFLLFGVFHIFESQNKELTTWGLARNENDVDYWKQLPNEDYFPFQRGEQQTRLWCSRPWRHGTKTEHWTAWQDLGQRIMERYNREHPTKPITKVAFQQLRWPRSAEGFYAHESESKGTKRYWIVADATMKKVAQENVDSDEN